MMAKILQPGIDYVGISTPFYCNDGKGNFVFHKRSKNCRDEWGRWDTGSGKLEFGQSPEENVLREVKEEYGVKGIIQEQLPPHSIFRINKGRKTHWLVIPFFILVDPSAVKINDPEKIYEIKWFCLSKLPNPLHTGFQYTLGRYKKYFEKYKK